VRQRLHRSQNRDQVLNSTSAGASIVDVYIQRELGDEEFVFEDPDYQAMSDLPHHDEVRQGGDVDLEKGRTSKTGITRTDSGFPRMGSESEGYASSSRIATSSRGGSRSS
jgi:hypothetical protein